MSRPEYLAFTLKFNGIANRIITPVQISEAFDPNSPLATHPQPFQTKALWDTGATRSVITASTALALGLKAVGVTKVRHAGGQSDHNTHVVNFILPNNVGVPGVLVSECPDVAGEFGAIVGMDIICRGDMSISNHNGLTWFTFRFPSMRGQDFVADFNARQRQVVGRNEPCPCGSGKKFKKCHGA